MLELECSPGHPPDPPAQACFPLPVLSGPWYLSFLALITIMVIIHVCA